MNHRRFVEETTPMAHGTQGPKELQGNSRKYHTKWTGTYAAVEQDGSSGLVIEVFDDSDKVGADVALLHGCPKSCMQIPVEGLLEVYEDMVEVLLVLEIFLTEDS